MDTIGKNLKSKFETVKQQVPEVNYEKVINTAGAVGSSATGIYSYRSNGRKQIEHQITKYKYAEELRKAVLQGEMSRERAGIMCREIGIKESYLDPMEIKTSEPSQSRFAGITVSNPAPTYLVPENKMKIGVVAILSMILYFILLRIAKLVVRLLRER